MSIRTKGAIWFSAAALLIGAAIFYFTFSSHQSLELSEIATDIAWATVIAIIAGAWGFKYATNIAKAPTAIKAFGWGCLVASLSLLSFDILLWLVFMIGGIIDWFTNASSSNSFASLFAGLLLLLPMILFVSFFVAYIGIVFAGIAGWLFWRRYR